MGMMACMSLEHVLVILKTHTRVEADRLLIASLDISTLTHGQSIRGLEIGAFLEEKEEPSFDEWDTVGY